MFSMLKNLKKYDRSLYDQVENMGMGKDYVAEKPATSMPKEQVPGANKFAKLKNLMKPKY